MPLRQILKTYTKSELSIIAWRSAETAYNMSQIQCQQPANVGKEPGDRPVEASELEEKLGPVIVDKFGGVDGEVDLRKLTGQEAIRFMKALGDTGSIN